MKYLFFQMKIARLFCKIHTDKVKQLTDEMLIVKHRGDDEMINSIADDIIENKGYAAEHPLARTFW